MLQCCQYLCRYRDTNIQWMLVNSAHAHKAIFVDLPSARNCSKFSCVCLIPRNNCFLKTPGSSHLSRLCLLEGTSRLQTNLCKAIKKTTVLLPRFCDKWCLACNFRIVQMPLCKYKQKHLDMAWKAFSSAQDKWNLSEDMHSLTLPLPNCMFSILTAGPQHLIAGPQEAKKSTRMDFPIPNVICIPQLPSMNIGQRIKIAANHCQKFSAELFFQPFFFKTWCFFSISLSKAKLIKDVC